MRGENHVSTTAQPHRKPPALDDAQPIARQIYAALRQRIVRAELLPGEVISETEVAREYGISRQPVREAFIKLAEGDLVQIRPQRGTMISRISRDGVMDARFIREAIEADIVRSLAGTIDDAMIKELRSQIAAQLALGLEQADEFVKLDELFHRSLAEMAGVSGAWSVIENVKTQMDRVRFLSVQRSHVEKLISQHAAVVEALAKREAAAAEQAIRLHLREILKTFPELERTRPELFSPGS